jgi:peptidyl-prolyl cis-trans isomerase A (cyclophilin A)
VTYAKAGPNTRTTQVFINLGDNAGLDKQGFSPFGRVVQGLEVVEKLHSEYGDSLTSAQGSIYKEGNVFLAQKAPKLDFIKKATIVAQPAK